MECCTEPPELMTPVAMMELIKIPSLPVLTIQYELVETAARKYESPNWIDIGSLVVLALADPYSLHRRNQWYHVAPVAILINAPFTATKLISINGFRINQLRYDVFSEVMA